MSAITIKGQLAKQAWAPVRTDGTAVIMALIEQPGARPVLVQHVVGSTPAARYAAANTARHLQKGTDVTAHGTHMQPKQHQGQPAMELVNARLLLSHPINHHEPAAQA